MQEETQKVQVKHVNRTKIEWTNFTWNPITGCKHGCWYCYAKRGYERFHRSFEPTFHPERLNEIDELKKPAKVFVCSVADLFAPWTPIEWRDAVLDKIDEPKYDHLTFQLLTKNPEDIPRREFRDNVWIGATITDASEGNKAPELAHHALTKVHFLSFEPMLGSHRIMDWRHIEWIIIGKLTGSKKVKLDPNWVRALIEEARYNHLPIFVKNNIGWPERIQDFPKVP